MNVWLILILLAASLAMMLLERRGLRTTLQLPMKGDIKRESRFLAQYGQLVCTALAALLIVQLDHGRDSRGPRAGLAVPMCAGVLLATTSSMLIKRLLGRIRPGRENAGKFLGPSMKHSNHRESFPSSHSASAVAFAVGMSAMYPSAAITFWALALVCAALRYMLDAHWPSDILAGIALGYASACLSWWFFVVWMYRR